MKNCLETMANMELELVNAAMAMMMGANQRGVAERRVVDFDDDVDVVKNHEALKVVAKEVLRTYPDPEISQLSKIEPAVEMMAQTMSMLFTKITLTPIRDGFGNVVGVCGDIKE